jgi:cell filamentation protein
LSKYEVNPDEDFQPGSTEVLKNFLNIRDPEVISEEETKALKAAYQYYTNQLNADDPITIKLILEMHKKWLGNIYPFAGKFRTVVMSKGGFLFAAPPQIERLLADFEKNELASLTPCHGLSIEEIALSMAVIHVEFILIHPFREGNGRLARLIAYIMGLQAGYPPLNFESIDDKSMETHKRYIAAIHRGLEKDYSAMQQIFIGILRNSDPMESL